MTRSVKSLKRSRAMFLNWPPGCESTPLPERLPWPAAHGEWVKKFRRMVVMETLPAAEDRDAPTA